MFIIGMNLFIIKVRNCQLSPDGEYKMLFGSGKS